MIFEAGAMGVTLFLLVFALLIFAGIIKHIDEIDHDKQAKSQ